MVEAKLVPWVVLMMAVGLLYAFDGYYDSGGATGYVIANTAIGNHDCRDTDNNDARVAGVTISTTYTNGERSDTCVRNDLLEFYCSESGADVRAVHCPRGCFAGACN